MARGGARPGAGRPRKAEKYSGQIAAAEDRIAGGDQLAELVDNLLDLARGGYQRVREQWEPAGTVMLEVPAMAPELDDGGRPVVGPDGEPRLKPVINPYTNAPVMTRVPAYPHLPPGELVCVSRTTETADRDRQANEYLLNRILGRPTQAIELGGADGEPLSITFESAVLSAYGPDAGEADPGAPDDEESPETDAG